MMVKRFYFFIAIGAVSLSLSGCFSGLSDLRDDVESLRNAVKESEVKIRRLEHEVRRLQAHIEEIETSYKDELESPERIRGAVLEDAGSEEKKGKAMRMFGRDKKAE